MLFDPTPYKKIDYRKFSCVTCGLLNHCNSPKIKPFGKFAKKILIVGEYPDEVDDKYGKPFMGSQGRVLKRALRDHNIDLEKDCLSTYALKCYPTKKVKKHQVISCRRYLLNVIDKYKPHIIVLMGDLAIESIIANEWKKDLGKIEKWRGWTIPSQTHNAWICPIYAPNFVSRGETEVNTIWQKDWEEIAKLSHIPVPKYQEPTIEIINDLSVLEKINYETEIVIDYETTGIKPHAVGHEILAIGIADTSDHAYVFSQQDRKKLYPFIDLLKDKRIKKIAHNMKFEDHWTKHILKINIRNWWFDTQTAAHILDNREGITSLKFQTFVRLGIADYDSQITPYIKAKDSNSFNKIKQYMQSSTGYNQVLTYCGYDVINTYRIAQLMQNKIGFTIFEDNLPF